MKLFYSIVLIIGFATAAVAQDTNATIRVIFKQYDEDVLQKITKHWYQTLDSMPQKDSLPVGKLALEFHLFPDGHISDLKTDSSDVKSNFVEFCKQAVTDSAPFANWTKNIRQVYTNDFRVINFTFYLNSEPTPPNAMSKTNK